MPSRAPLRFRLFFLVAAAAFLVALVLPSLWVEFRYSARIHSVESARAAPTAIVFGAGLAPGKAASPILAQRLDAAIALYKAGKVQRLLLSGDNQDRYHDEPGAMKRYALARGIPTEAMDSDPAGLSTFASCDRARREFQVTRAILVSQDFHLPRALYIANGLGIDADGVMADEPPSFHFTYELRELFSRTLAFARVLIE